MEYTNAVDYPDGISIKPLMLDGGEPRERLILALLSNDSIYVGYSDLICDFSGFIKLRDARLVYAAEGSKECYCLATGIDSPCHILPGKSVDTFLRNIEQYYELPFKSIGEWESQ